MLIIDNYMYVYVNFKTSNIKIEEKEIFDFVKEYYLKNRNKKSHEYRFSHDKLYIQYYMIDIKKFFKNLNENNIKIGDIFKVKERCFNIFKKNLLESEILLNNGEIVIRNDMIAPNFNLDIVKENKNLKSVECLKYEGVKEFIETYLNTYLDYNLYDFLKLTENLSSF